VAQTDEDLAEALIRTALFGQGDGDLFDRQEARLDEEIPQGVTATAEALVFLTEGRRGVLPELLNVIEGSFAEALQAVRTDLRRILGVVTAPGSLDGLELGRAVKTGHDVQVFVRRHAWVRSRWSGEGAGATGS
jgi:hypothetical protein